jgi:hypothetical protein
MVRDKTDSEVVERSEALQESLRDGFAACGDEDEYLIEVGDSRLLGGSKCLP